MHLRLSVLITLMMLALVCLGGCKTQTFTIGERSTPPDEVSRDDLLSQTRPLEDEPVHYRPPTLAEAMAAEQAIPLLLDSLSQDTDLEPTRELFAEASIALTTFAGDDPWWVLYEGGENWRGTGTYIFRAKRGRPLIVQTPHTWHDRQTGEIGMALFERGVGHALFFNTIHRYGATPEERSRDASHPADVAHATDAYYYAITRTYLEQHPDAAIVQLHGFASESLAKKGIDVVLSDGTDEPGAHLEDWHRAFADTFGEDRVASYPDDTGRYGATGNTIGRLIRLSQRGTFVHVELSADLRSELAGSIEPLVEVFDSVESE